MDVNSGDGKMVSFRCGEGFRKFSGNYWSGMVKHFKRPDFIAALYHYLNSVDVSNYDFKVERQRVLTDSYRRLLEASIRLVARFFVYLLRKMLTQSCEVDCGNLIFFQPPEAEKRRPPVGDLKIRRPIVFGMFEEYKKSVKVSKEYSRYAFYRKVRELKRCDWCVALIHVQSTTSEWRKGRGPHQIATKYVLYVSP